MDRPADIAVYAEHSDSRKPAVAGWNVRVFNRTEFSQGNGIVLDSDNTVIKLAPGVYQISASSIATYDDMFPGPAQGWGTEQRPNGGYCRLRRKADADCKNEKAIAIGTISNANMLPSLIDTYFKTTEPVEIVLEHQVGDQVAGIYFQDNATNSSWHVFARIAIRAL